MAKLKKNQLANIVFPIVDGIDFATIESGITASNFDSKMTKKFFGVNHGNSTAFTSGTISKAIGLVRSGIFQQTLKAAETNYDQILYSFYPANTSLAQQILVFETATYDDSDMYSYLSDVGSNIVSMVSDLISLTSDVDSQLIVNYSLLSDVESQVNLNASLLDEIISDAYIMSGVISNLVSQVSDIESQVDLNESMLSDFYSHVLSGIVVGGSSISDITSAVEVMIETAIIPLGASNISDVASRVWSEKYTDHSLVSSFGSLMSDMQSNLYSAIGAVTATLSSDAMSDIGVEVWANATGVRVDSRILVVQSLVSDAHSDLKSYLVGMSGALSDVESQVDLLTTSDYSSKMHSDIVSAIGNVSVVLTASDISDIASAVTAAGVAITDSDMSDIASRVWATAAASAVESNLSILLSNVSDVESQVNLNASLLATINNQASVLLSNVSDVESQIDAGVTISVSSISDISSRVWAADYSDLGVGASSFGSVFIVNTSRLSDVYSLVSDIDSQITLDVSTLSDIYSLVSNVESQLDLTASLVSDVDSQLTLNTATLSDFQSNLLSRVPKRVATDSQVSNLASDLRSYLVGMSGALSDVDSQVLLNASMISDIDSQMTLDVSTLSDIYSLVSNVESQLDLTASVVSDIDSQLTITHSLLSDVESAVDAIWTTAITEAYAVDGAAMTPAQALYMIWANTAEFSIAGTTLTVKELDGATGAMTFTLDSATDPTSRTRAT